LKYNILLLYIFIIVFQNAVLNNESQGQKSALDVTNGTLGKQQDTQDHYNLALDAIEKKDYETAMEYLKQVLAENHLFQELSGKSAWYQLGYVLEQEDDKFTAIKVLEQGLDTLKSAGLIDPYLNYNLARMYAENRIEDRETQITELIYEVFQNLSPQKQPDLWQRLVDVVHFSLSKSERAQLDKATSQPGEKPGMIFYSFFRREDPNPITEQNELLSIVFQRAAEAREQFPDYSSPRGCDDRGDIYVRLGPPWKIHPNHSGILGEIGHAIYPYEVWLYPQIHPDLYVTFMRERGHSYFEQVAGPEAFLGTFYKGRRTFFNKLNPGQTATNLRFYLYEDLAGLHPTFKNRLSRLQEQYTNAEAADYARIHFVNEDRSHAAFLDTLMQSIGFVTDQVLQTLPLQLSGSWFSDEKDRLRIEFYYAIKNADLFYDSEGDKFFTILKGEVGVFNENFKLITHDSLKHYATVPTSSETKSGTFISQWDVSLKPGKYNLFFRLENPNSKKRATIRTDFELEPVPETGLYLSDIQLALDVQSSDEKGLFHKKGYFVKPKPGNKIEIGRKFFVYFENYRLSLDDEGKSHYQIEYLLQREEVKGRFLGLFGGKLQDEILYQEKIDRSGHSSAQADYKELVFTGLKKGDYQLKITVTDLSSGEQAGNDIPIQLQGIIFPAEGHRSRRGSPKF